MAWTVGYVLLQLLFWISIGLLLHSYVFYHIIMRLLARSKNANQIQYSAEDTWPRVAILMAAHNEEEVLAQKMETLINQDYLSDRIQIFVGSDASTDKTNGILHKYAKTHDHVHFHLFKERKGKPGIINTLAQEAMWMGEPADEELFLLTDASVMLEPDVITKLAAHFKNPKVGLVDAHMHYTGMEKDGISTAEDTYLNQEVRLKQAESMAFGTMMGPFGGCYMMRSELYHPIPPSFLVDDFFLSMQVFRKGKQCINELSAICREPVTHKLSEEFRRKKRIAAGNFQNLKYFRSMLNPFSPLGFSFISHKVIRWIGPILILMALLSSAALMLFYGSIFFSCVTVLILICAFLFPLMDSLFSAFGLHIGLLRKIRYFNLMNVAMMAGMIRYVKGVKNNIWQPTERVV